MSAAGKPGATARWDDWYRRTLPAYWIFMICATHFPSARLPQIPESDKIAHMCGYGLLAFLLWRFARTFSGPRPVVLAVMSIIAIALYAAIDEWTQPLFNRTCSLADWSADILGATAVLGTLALFARRHTRRRGEAGSDKALESPPAGR